MQSERFQRPSCSACWLVGFPSMQPKDFSLQKAVSFSKQLAYLFSPLRKSHCCINLHCCSNLTTTLAYAMFQTSELYSTLHRREISLILPLFHLLIFPHIEAHTLTSEITLPHLYTFLLSQSVGLGFVEYSFPFFYAIALSSRPLWRSEESVFFNRSTIQIQVWPSGLEMVTMFAYNPVCTANSN